jgi:hypothetical protein
MRKSDADYIDYQRRKHRVFHRNWQWFYHTRNGPRGPFAAKQIAIDDLIRFVDTMNFIDRNPNRFPAELNLDDITYIDIKLPRY